MRSVDWIFIIEALAWRLLGECVTLENTFHSLLFEQEIVAASYFQIFFRIALLEEAFIRNIIIMLSLYSLIIICMKHNNNND